MYSGAVQYLLVGNYGVGNFGDEALKEYFLTTFPDVEWRVLSARPEEGEYPRLPFGFRSLFSPWWRTIGALRRSDGLVFGGGTLFTDIESVRACLIWWWHAFVAWMLGKKIILAFQGIGPFKVGAGPPSRFALRRAGEWCARWTVARAVFVSVRDAASARRVETWKKNTKVIQTCDPVFSLLKAKSGDRGAQKLLVIIPRKNSPVAFTERAAQLQKTGEWKEVRILSFQPDDPQEYSLCMRLAGETGVVVPVRTIGDLRGELSAASFVLTQRYHGAVGALALGVPFEVVPQGEGDKLAGLAGMLKGDAVALAAAGEGALRSALFPSMEESDTL